MAPSRGRGGSNKTQARSSSNLRNKPKDTSASNSSSAPSASKLTSVPLATSTTSSASKDRSNAPSAALVQSLLHAFTSSFPDLLESNAAANILPDVLQQVKHFLYERDFTQAFGKPEFLEAYAARWSASRSAGYCEIFSEVIERYLSDTQDGDTLGVVCLGGGSGAELVGLAGAHHQLDSQSNFRIATIDNADWSHVLTALCRSLTSPPSILKSAQLTHTFHQQDLLSSDTLHSLKYHIENFQLITLMFTLNELFSSSLSSTQSLLLDITAAASPGTLLLVVDSPGSYSTVQLAGKEKQYPMAWMMDHVLLKIASELHEQDDDNDNVDQESKEEESQADEVHQLSNKVKKVQISEHSNSNNSSSRTKAGNSPKWEKILNEPSRWYRLPKGLEYPIELEDMRVQMYLYRRC